MDDEDGPVKQEKGTIPAEMRHSGTIQGEIVEESDRGPAEQELGEEIFRVGSPDDIASEHRERRFVAPEERFTRVQRTKSLESRINQLERDLTDVTSQTEGLYEGERFKAAIDEVLSKNDLVGDPLFTTETELQKYLKEEYNLDHSTISNLQNFRESSTEYHKANLKYKNKLRSVESLGVFILGLGVMLTIGGLAQGNPQFFDGIFNQLIMGGVVVIGLLLALVGLIGINKEGIQV